MATQITLPRLGQGMESGVIVRWLKDEGDPVSKGEPLYELDTEKVTQEVEADADGVLLKIVQLEGAEVPVGELIAVIGEAGEAAPDDVAPAVPAPAAAPAPVAAGSDGAVAAAATPVAAVASAPVQVAAAPVAAAAVATPAAGGRIKASPLARRIAKDRGVDLSTVGGTGPEGRIVAEDVERAAAGEAPAAAPTSAPPAPTADEAPAVKTVEFTSMRKVIARRMAESWQAPHFQVSLTADVGSMISLRESLVAATSEGGVRPTYSDIITKLVAVGLTRHPALNAHFAGDAVHQYGPANIGLAIAVEGGLVVPVIPACERRRSP
jgi:pyruvate dehydrogenase E2 component (dihydrolipoamide acetyltransferase)